MAEARFTKNRDHRFNDWRRNAIRKRGQVVKLPLYMIDIDGVEYGYLRRKHPYKDETLRYPTALAIIEYKCGPSWLTVWRDQLTVQIDMAAKLGIPFYVVEHNEDFSCAQIYHITQHPVWTRLPNSDDLVSLRNGRTSGGVADLVDFICRLHNHVLPPQVYEDWSQYINGIELCEDGNVREIAHAEKQAIKDEES